MASRPKKSLSSKARRVRRITPCAPLVRRTRSDGRKRAARPSLRREFRAWRASLPTALERDTLLVPEWIAESVVQEAERFLQAPLPDDLVERLAAKAYYLFPRHKHFHKVLNRPGNGGRDTLYMYMRHWNAAWLRRERFPLFKKLPYSYALGRPLPVASLTQTLLLASAH